MNLFVQSVQLFEIELHNGALARVGCYNQVLHFESVPIVGQCICTLGCRCLGEEELFGKIDIKCYSFLHSIEYLGMDDFEPD